MAASDSDTNYFFLEDRRALVLAGGGARAAYQVGVLEAIAEWLPREAPCPFPVLIGTSAGAINIAALAAQPESMRDAVDALCRVWRGFHIDQVVGVDNWSMVQGGLRWVLAVISGGWITRPPRSLLDTSPLRALLERVVPVERIAENVARGAVRAIAVSTTSYASGRTVSFFDAAPDVRDWNRVRRAGVRRRIDHDVLMASSAIPFIFPAGRVGEEWFGDGAMRQLAPLSPAVHLGANRLLVIGTRTEPGRVQVERGANGPPSPGHLLGFVLDALFTDGLSIDLERLQQVNALLSAGAQAEVTNRRPIDVLVIQPSVDPTAIARRYIDALPRSLRTLLRTMGALEARGGLLASYLLFESAYTTELMALGRADAIAKKEQLQRFIG